MTASNTRELGLTMLLYVSRAVLPSDGEMDAVNHIVEASVQRNASLNVNGALIWTGRHFAQVLEGQDAEISQLMRSIRSDERHRHLTVVANNSAVSRRFADWAMAYAGASAYLDQVLKQLLSPSVARSRKTELAEEVVATMERLI